MWIENTPLKHVGRVAPIGYIERRVKKKVRKKRAEKNQFKPIEKEEGVKKKKEKKVESGREYNRENLKKKTLLKLEIWLLKRKKFQKKSDGKMEIIKVALKQKKK